MEAVAEDFTKLIKRMVHDHLTHIHRLDRMLLDFVVQRVTYAAREGAPLADLPKLIDRSVQEYGM